MKKIPKWLQSTLWSVKIGHLDVKENKAYIINQILVYGGMKELKWLFKAYSRKTIKEVFINNPTKIYTPPAFNFAKEILLGLRERKLDPYKYDRDLPRIIRH